jgi:hypothetical protein
MLAKGALHAMSIAKLKAAVLITATCAVVAGTSVVIAEKVQPAPTTPAAAPNATEPAAVTRISRGRIVKIEPGELTLHVLRGPSGIMRPVALNTNTVVMLPGGKQGPRWAGPGGNLDGNGEAGENAIPDQRTSAFCGVDREPLRARGAA